jgi:hypothetical protein
VIQRIGIDFGAYTFAAPARLEFVGPAGILEGDILLVMIAADGNIPTPTTAPDGWTLHVEEDVPAEPRHGELWAKVADGTEAGATLAFPSGGNLLGGVLVVYRDGPVLPPQVADVDSFAALRTIATANHTTPDVEGSQAEDRRLLLWWVKSIAVTITEAVDAHFESFGKELDANTGWVTAGEFLLGEIGDDGALTVTSSAATNGVTVAVALRVRAIVQAVGLTEALPGHIGLLP